jgi:DNA invertase Pin-like site-specific DNA recombinase
MNDKITSEHLNRGAIVYIRQSSLGQVIGNKESRHRQYALAKRAENIGFKKVQVIDEDLGRSGSGLVDRPGFEKLVSSVCKGNVGAVFSLEASRLSRNGKDWHHLIDLCGLVNTLLVDHDGVYDPGLINDRLLLGLKGSMSEFELSLFRQRSKEAIKAKAMRGELRFCLPVGLCWTEEGGIELDVDLRVRQTVKMVFEKFVELGSVRQVLMWFREEQLSLPRIKNNKNSTPNREIIWRPAYYKAFLAIIRNPLYAGAYVFGRSEARTSVIDGKAHRTNGHMKSRENWTVLIREHHTGYIDFERYERNQRILLENTHMKQTAVHKSARGGHGLLGGLLRCARCGQRLHVVYTRGNYPRYECRMANKAHGAPRCISFGGLKVDDAITKELIQVVQPHSVEVAIAASKHTSQAHEEHRTALKLELEQAQYETRLTARKYDVVDPDNRLVAGELESRWNESLRREQEVNFRLEVFDREAPKSRDIDRQQLFELAEDLFSVWNSETSDMRVKQRIVRLLLEEIVVDIDDSAAQILMKLHWCGGRHSELRIQRPKPGQHNNVTCTDALEVIRQMAGQWPDKEIGATLNRLGLKTGVGNTWTESRVYSVRRKHRLLDYSPSVNAQEMLTLNQAADRLGVGSWVVRRLIKIGILEADQIVRSAPWQIKVSALEKDDIKKAIHAIKTRNFRPASGDDNDPNLTIPGI